MNMHWRFALILVPFIMIAIRYRRDSSIMINAAAIAVFFGAGWLMQLPGLPDWANMLAALLMIGMVALAVALNAVDIMRWLRSKRPLP
jgi:hypothetical protein